MIRFLLTKEQQVGIGDGCQHYFAEYCVKGGDTFYPCKITSERMWIVSKQLEAFIVLFYSAGTVLITVETLT